MQIPLTLRFVEDIVENRYKGRRESINNRDDITLQYEKESVLSTITYESDVRIYARGEPTRIL